MPIMNSRYQWGAVSIALHWIVFLMAAAMFATGKISAQGGGRPDPELMAVHVPLGTALLFVMAARYLWRLLNPGVGKVDDAVGLGMQMTAWLVHNLLYFAVIAQALVGVAMTQAGGREVELLGWTLPKLLGSGGLLPLEHPILAQLNLGETAQEARKALRGFHTIVGNTLIGLVVLHILGALYHLLGRRDHLLRRMWFGYTPPDLKRKEEKA